jgi:2-succinyl-5-enolpyruvyl-6-hydroxy-3-cyclohexene-1-carboxylate synthase
VIVSADRPREYRGTGAPQSIEQREIFLPFVSQAYDFDLGDDFSPDLSSDAGPLHINVCVAESADKKPIKHQPVRSHSKPRPNAMSLVDARRIVERFMQKAKRPLVMIGSLDPASRDAVVSTVLALNAPCWIESCSGLRGHPALEHLRIRVSDRFWSHLDFDAVLRIGSVPTLRFWRDLAARNIETLGFDPLGFSGSPHAQVISGDLEQSLKWLQAPATKYESLDWLPAMNRLESRILGLLASHPKSEPTWVHRLSRQIPKDAFLYLGNSLPIREWDMFAKASSHYAVGASRGANGIDGQIATFLGQSAAYKHSVALLGDQTFRYDAKALLLAKLALTKARHADIFVMNNGGGQIFKRLPQLRALNPNVLESSIVQANADSVEPFAKAFNWDFEQWVNEPKTYFESHGAPRVIELLPDPQQSQAFWQDYEALS